MPESVRNPEATLSPHERIITAANRVSASMQTQPPDGRPPLAGSILPNPNSDLFAVQHASLYPEGKPYAGASATVAWPDDRSVHTCNSLRIVIPSEYEPWVHDYAPIGRQPKKALRISVEADGAMRLDTFLTSGNVRVPVLYTDIVGPDKNTVQRQYCTATVNEFRLTELPDAMSEALAGCFESLASAAEAYVQSDTLTPEDLLPFSDLPKRAA